MLSEGIVSAKLLFKYLSKNLKISEVDQNEINSIIYIVLEHVFNISRLDVIVEKEINAGVEQIDLIEEIIFKLNSHHPIQYITGKSEFYGLKLELSPGVLIPRPETEELVDLIIKENNKPSLKVLDIGTGSGCIAITLKKFLKNSELYAFDIDETALKIAVQNACINNVKINFLQLDIFNDLLDYHTFDIIVSNPPYVLEKEKKDMKKNVLWFEPASALFVPDHDPLKFYKRITEISQRLLKSGGALYFEINERYGHNIKNLLMKNNYLQIEVLQDFQSKDRFIKGVKP
jgi:release factor glutamine methyltransferase